jgi:hypothetical protein
MPLKSINSLDAVYVAEILIGGVLRWKKNSKEIQVHTTVCTL